MPGPPDPLLPGRYRLAALLAVLTCAAITAVIGVLVWHGTRADALDSAVLRVLRPSEGTPAGTDLTVIARLGGAIPVTVLTALLCYCCLALRRYQGAVLLAAGVLVTSGLTELVLKPLVHRTYDGFLSYPSGHTSVVFALITGVGVVLLSGRPAGRAAAGLRLVLTAGAVVTGCAVAAGLVVAHMHYFTDTIGGAATGTGVTLTVALFIDLITAQRVARPGGPPDTPALEEGQASSAAADRLSSHRG